ncbi:MAG: sulfite exporter TauE/SafE family protein [Acetobacteraceae bacterium]|nr:sulfite exporter TauE/SafE family protein [Acetobacteraceae bacterium]
MGVGSVGLALLAGALSVLSPCVLPLLPIVLGGASAAHRAGPFLLALGLAVSFTAIGVFVATLGLAIGLDETVLRTGFAVLLGMLGAVLLSSALQARWALATGTLSDAGSRLLERLSPRGAPGQLLIGLVLGAVWAPCVGPTLGAASILAAQRQELGAVVAVMLAFGIGAALPLLLIAILSQRAFRRWRGRITYAGSMGKALFGGAVVLTALLILTGADRAAESWAVANSPAWLTDLTTRF